MLAGAFHHKPADAGAYDIFITVQGEGAAVQRQYEATATWTEPYA